MRAAENQVGLRLFVGTRSTMSRRRWLLQIRLDRILRPDDEAVCAAAPFLVSSA
jgi:hypothetical protein